MDKSQITSLLQTMGIDTQNINSDKLMKMMSKIKDPTNIDPEILSEFTNILTKNNEKKNTNTKNTKTIKFGRNEKCPCESGKKWKNCCI